MPARSVVLAWLKLLVLPLVFLAATVAGPAPRVDEGAAWVQPVQKANTKSINVRIRGIDYAIRDAHGSPFTPAAVVRVELATTRTSAVLRAPLHVRAATPFVLRSARAPPALS